MYLHLTSIRKIEDFSIYSGDCNIENGVCGRLAGAGQGEVDGPEASHSEGLAGREGGAIGGAARVQGGGGGAHVHDLHVDGEFDGGIADALILPVFYLDGDSVALSGSRWS